MKVTEIKRAESLAPIVYVRVEFEHDNGRIGWVTVSRATIPVSNHRPSSVQIDGINDEGKVWSEGDTNMFSKLRQSAIALALAINTYYGIK